MTDFYVIDFTQVLHEKVCIVILFFFFIITRRIQGLNQICFIFHKQEDKRFDFIFSNAIHQSIRFRCHLGQIILLFSH
jgi:hypothetical protein